MKSISLSFQIHHPFHLKKYRFFDIGNDSYYYDDFENERAIRFVAENYYLPANEVLIGLLNQYLGHFKIAFSISGTALDLFYLYAPEVIESFQRMADTGGVEFLCETYSHSFASLHNKSEFVRQVNAHSKKIKNLFDQVPRVFKNTELIYSDLIGEMVSELGFKAVLTEGVKHVLRWRSPNYLYRNPLRPELSLLLKNSHLSENIAFRLTNPEYPGRTNSYQSVLNNIPSPEKIVNIFMNYEMIGQGKKKGKGIFNFLKSFPSTVLEKTEYEFMTPSEMVAYYHSVSDILVPDPICREVSEGEAFTSWLGNELQQEAMAKLYSVNNKIENCNNTDLVKDWQYLQSSDHFYYMSSKFFTNQEGSSFINPYNNPYEAFMNYMNVLDDFVIRLNRSDLKYVRLLTYTKSGKMKKEKQYETFKNP